MLKILKRLNTESMFRVTPRGHSPELELGSALSGFTNKTHITEEKYNQDWLPVCLPPKTLLVQLRLCTVSFALIKQGKHLLPRMPFWEKSQATSNKAGYFPHCVFS